MINKTLFDLHNYFNKHVPEDWPMVKVYNKVQDLWTIHRCPCGAWYCQNPDESSGRRVAVKCSHHKQFISAIIMGLHQLGYREEFLQYLKLIDYKDMPIFNEHNYNNGWVGFECINPNR